MSAVELGNDDLQPPQENRFCTNKQRVVHFSP